jgi:hypothetical protein
MNAAPQLVEWDDDNKKEIEEAKSIYQKAREQNREIEDLFGNMVEYFRPSLKGFRIKGQRLKPHQFSMRILNEKGDETLIWDSRDPDEVKEAAKIFNKYIEKGWRAFATDIEGNRSRRIRAFDAEKEEVIFEEDNTKEKLQKFVGKFSEIKVLPKTYPG